MSDFVYLNRSDILAAGGGDWHRALDDIRAATKLLAAGEAEMVAENVLPLGNDPRDKAYGLPARLGGSFDAAGLKWTIHKAKPQGGFPSINSRTLVHCASTGQLVGMVESAMLTRMRTGAVSALTLEALLASPCKVAAVLGAGEMALAHLQMLNTLFPDLESIEVWNRTPAHLDAMLTKFTPREGLIIRRLDKPEDSEAEAIFTCTSSPRPIVGLDMVRPGRLIAQIGFHEVSAEAILASDQVIVDAWGEFANTSAKSLFQAYRQGCLTSQQVTADLIAITAPDWLPRAGASVYFSSFGLNIFDLALACRVLKDAEALCCGQVVRVGGE